MQTSSIVTTGNCVGGGWLINGKSASESLASWMIAMCVYFFRCMGIVHAGFITVTD